VRSLALLTIQRGDFPLVPDVQAIEGLLCSHSFSVAGLGCLPDMDCHLLAWRCRNRLPSRGELPKMNRMRARSHGSLYVNHNYEGRFLQALARGLCRVIKSRAFNSGMFTGVLDA